MPDLNIGMVTFEVTLADGRVVIVDQINLLGIVSGPRSPFAATSGYLTQDNANLQYDDTNNIRKVANLRVLASGTYRQVDGNGQLIHAMGTTT